MHKTSTPASYFDPRLVTNVLKLEYDYVAKTGRLYMPPLCCTDFSGVIALFQHIHPHVERIETYAGEEPDTFYTMSRGEWTAHPPPRS